MLELAADDVPARVAAERVAPQQQDVDHEDDRPEAEAELAAAREEREHRVVGVDQRSRLAR